MDKNKQVESFEEVISSLGFQMTDKDEYSIKYKKNNVLLQIFFGRYSEKPDIFVRFEDESIPESFTVSSMMFIDEQSRGNNSLKDIDIADRLIYLIRYFGQNSGVLLTKKYCRERKKDVNKYLAESF